MKVKLGQAVKVFFGNSSLEMVYFEAIANSLDAGATKINIKITADAYNRPSSLKISISDNGEGFTDERYSKFSNLFDVDENSHKGLGRLVYLCYFEKIRISSTFNGSQRRIFEFSENFKEEENIVTTIPLTTSGTEITMSVYTLTRLRKSEFIQPKYLKETILHEFYSRFFQLKEDGKEIEVEIEAMVENHNTKEIINSDAIPQFKKVEVESSLGLFDKFYLYYSILKVDDVDSSLVAAVSVDNRTVKVEIIAEENKPLGYSMVFLLYSDWFKGKVDPSRQNLNLTDSELNNIQTAFRKKVANIIEEEIPEVLARNRTTKNNLIEVFPHLSNYFNSDNIGYASRNDIIKKAQEQFFKAQKEVLEATTLSDEQFIKSLELSSTALTEYILFRQLIINKLKKTNESNSEADIHNLFAKMKTQFLGSEKSEDIYRNNAWLLDDKYMTYETILSDREIGDLINFITNGEDAQRDEDRPDIAFVFSNNPQENAKFDVVMVELKKRGLTVEGNMVIETQLKKRAQKLMTYYNNAIQRVWYYGIIEINEAVELMLSDYNELYSSGKMFYKETSVGIQVEPKITLPIQLYIWDINAVIKDADLRNSAFLNLIKSKFKR